MFFIHGGTYVRQSGAAPVYNGEIMANKGDVIVVTINYRLGAFGSLVTGTSGDDLTGNYGMMDTLKALKWVNRNIRRFGGDNTKITLFGQSAGAYSVSILLASAKAKGLFSRAIIQSAPYAIPLKTLDLAVQQGDDFARLARCVDDTSIDVACLRALSPESIVQIQSTTFSFSDSQIRSGMAWLPHIDGKEVKQGILEGLLNSSIQAEQIMIGSAADEGLIFVRAIFDEPVSYIVGIIFTGLLVPNLPSGIWGYYPRKNNSDVREELQQMLTDYMFACPNRLIARQLSGQLPDYSYVFDEALPFDEEFYPKYEYCVDMVCHGSDMPYVFQSARQEPFAFNSDEILFSDKLVSYWTSFAKYGNPNQDLDNQVNGTEWEEYKIRGKTRESSIILTANEPEFNHVRNHRSEFCDQWDTTGYM